MAELLEPSGVVFIPATVKNFIVKDKFTVSAYKNYPVEILYIGRDFLQWFLGKIEKPKIKITLRFQNWLNCRLTVRFLPNLAAKLKLT